MAVVAAAVLLSLAGSYAEADCTMQTQMQATALATQQQRLNSITNNVQTLNYLNDLEQQCMQGFQSIPTQLGPVGNSSMTTEAINKLEQQACNALASKARNTAQSALTSAQSAAQSALNGMQTSGGNAVSGLSGSSSSSAGMFAQSVGSPSASGSGGGVINSVTSALSRLFQ